jgi:hypothetical protein
MLFKALDNLKQHDAVYFENNVTRNTYRCKFSHWVQDTLFGRLHSTKTVENLVCFNTAEKKFSSYAPQLKTIYFVIMLFKALHNLKQHDAE